jgi:hypothetical protein
MRMGLINGASILMSALLMYLAGRFAGPKRPEGHYYWQDNTWTEFMATQLGVHHPSITPEYRKKVFAIAIPVGVITFAISHFVLTTIF